MATPEYAAWVEDGKPLVPSQTIREMVERLRVTFPRASFSWYSDDSHYQASYPQDHTPYSYDAWPIAPCPYPRVCATDVMHRPDLGVDCDELFPYWLSEARAGHTPWRKYMIYKATIYDVRFGWEAQASSGHWGHIHLSDRTDWVDRSIGAWTVTGGGMALTQVEIDAIASATAERTKTAILTNGGIQFLVKRMHAVTTGQDPIALGTTLEPNSLFRLLLRIAERVEIDATELESIREAAREGAAAGSVQAVDEIVAAVLARLGEHAASPSDVESALRHVLLTGLADES